MTTDVSRDGKRHATHCLHFWFINFNHLDIVATHNDID